MSHKHLPGKIEYRGKVDSVYISCMKCSHIECVGVWTLTPPKNWSKKCWPKLHAAICLYLDSILAIYPRNSVKEYGGLTYTWSPLLNNKI